MGENLCPTCGKLFDGPGQCAECLETLAGVEEVLRSHATTIDELVAAIEAADGIDEIMDVLTWAAPPVDKLEEQRYRERLLPAMRGKVSAASKIVDAWLGTGEHDDNDAVTAGQASELVQLVQQRDALLFHTPDQTAFVALTIDGHREVHPIRSRSFKLWLARAYWEWTAADAAAADAEDDTNPELFGALAAVFKSGKPRVPKAQAITDAVATLEGLAIFDGDEHAVHVRLAHFGEHVYLDLGNEQWEAVEITATGWRVVAFPPVMFRRPPGLEALPYPVPGGTIAELRPFVNVDQDDGWVLLISYIVGLFSPGPYPVLVLLGEMGSAKSTLSKVVRRIIDPNTALLRRKPRSDHDLAIAANNGWVVTCDNLSSLPVWLSDAICTLATGGGFATRLLYSDTEEQLFDSMRPVVLNGIGDIAARSDLLDRALLLICPPITEKRPEREFWAAFELALPRILGAVLDAVVAAIAGVHDVVLDETPRMVDFAAWITAAEPALGLAPGSLLAAYLANRTATDQTALEASPIGHYLSRLGEWSGTATELLARLNEMANETDKITDADKIGPTRRQEGWPKAANALSGKLHLLAPNLRRIGVDVSIAHTERGSKITISPRVARDAKDRQDRQFRQPDDADDPGDDLHPLPDATAPTQPDATCEICGARGRLYLNHVLCDEHKDDLR